MKKLALCLAFLCLATSSQAVPGNSLAAPASTSIAAAGTSSYFLNSTTQTTNALRAKLAALWSAVGSGSTTASLKWDRIGDSTLHGYIVGGNAANYYSTSPTHILTMRLRAAGWPAQDNAVFGLAGNNTMVAPLYDDPRITHTGTVTVVQAPTVGGDFVSLATSTTNTISDTPIYPVDTFKFWYETASTNGTCTLQVNGGTATTVNETGSLSVQSVTVTSGAAPNIDTLKVGWGSGGPCSILGFEAWNSTISELRIEALGWVGSTSTSWNSSASPAAPIPMIGKLAPDIVDIGLTINDEGASPPTTISSFTANMQAIATAAAVTASVIYVSEVPIAITSTPYANQQAYVQAISGLAQSGGYPFIDMFDLWGSYEVQNPLGMYSINSPIHPSAGGYAKNGDTMFDLINPF